SPAPQAAPAPRPSTEPGHNSTSVRRMTHSGDVGAVSAFVLATCHGLSRALRLAMHAYFADSRKENRRCSRNKSVGPVAPLPRKWHVRHDRAKTTKGRHMGQELVAGAKAPALRFVATAAAQSRSRISRAAISSFISIRGP